MKTKFTLLHIALIALFSITVWASCTKEEDAKPTPNVPAPVDTSTSLTVEIEHAWGPSYLPFQMGIWYIHPATGDSLKFSRIQYYVSNIRLQRDDSTWWAEPNSYRLVNENSLAERTFRINNIPKGRYVKYEMMIGVDSSMSLSGIQTGALDPSNGMYWSWLTGYIFVKSEGFTPHSPTGTFQYHLGGFMQPYNAIQVRRYNLTGVKEITFNSGTHATMKMKSNVARFWHGGIRTSVLSVIHSPTDTAAMMAKNFADGFYVHSVTP